MCMPLQKYFVLIRSDNTTEKRPTRASFSYTTLIWSDDVTNDFYVTICVNQYNFDGFLRHFWPITHRTSHVCFLAQHKFSMDQTRSLIKICFRDCRKDLLIVIEITTTPLSAVRRGCWATHHVVLVSIHFIQDRDTTISSVWYHGRDCWYWEEWSRTLVRGAWCLWHRATRRLRCEDTARANYRWDGKRGICPCCLLD